MHKNWLKSGIFVLLFVTVIITSFYIQRYARKSEDSTSYSDVEAESLVDTEVDIKGDESSSNDEEIAESFIYEISGSGIRLTKYTGKDSVVSIPDEIENMKVTAIGEGTFESAKISELYISEYITDIESAVFSSCMGLKKIEVDPENQMFRSQDGVLFDKEMTRLICFPYGESYEIPEGVIDIAPYAFRSSDIENVSIPDSVINIYEYAFYGCGRMPSIDLPDSVEYIGDQAFAFCINLRDIKLSSNLKTIGDYVFLRCENLEEIHIPEGTETLGESVFLSCYTLSYISIPASVSEIGGGIFVFCYGLYDIDIAEDNPYYIVEDGVLYDRDMTIIVQYLQTKEEKYFEIPYGIQTIGDAAFYEAKLEEVILPVTVTDIEQEAFAYSNINSIIIPENVERIGKYAFECDNLTAVYFEGDAPKVEKNTFFDVLIFYKKDSEGWSNPWNGWVMEPY